MPLRRYSMDTGQSDSPKSSIQQSLVLESDYLINSSSILIRFTEISLNRQKDLIPHPQSSGHHLINSRLFLEHFSTGGRRLIRILTMLSRIWAISRILKIWSLVRFSPFNIIHIINANQFYCPGTCGTWKALNSGWKASHPRCVARTRRVETPYILITLIPRRPTRRGSRCRLETRKDINESRASRRAGFVEVKCACLPL